MARRPEFLNATEQERPARAFSGEAIPLVLLDAALVAEVSEVDRLCAYAVRTLQGSGQKAALLDVLGMLEPDRIVAMYYALPPKRREAVRNDFAWNYYVAEVEAEMPDAIWDVTSLAEGTTTTPLTRAVGRSLVTGESQEDDPRWLFPEHAELWH
jgi:hypothetical protein